MASFMERDVNLIASAPNAKGVTLTRNHAIDHVTSLCL